MWKKPLRDAKNFCTREKKKPSVKIFEKWSFPSREKKNPPVKKSEKVSVKILDRPWKVRKKCAWKRLCHPWKKPKKGRKWLSRALLIFTEKKKTLVKCAEKFSYGFKNLVKLGVDIINFKITIDRTVFNFSCKTSTFKERFFLFFVNF